MPPSKLPPGDATIEVRMVGPAKSTEPQTTRTKVDYHSRAVTRDLSAVGGRIMNAMLAAAQREDAIILSEQRPELLRTGKLRAGNEIATRWLEMNEDELIVIDKVQGTEDDLDMPAWGEPGWEEFVDSVPST